MAAETTLAFPGIVSMDPDHPPSYSPSGCNARWVARLNPRLSAMPATFTTFALDRHNAEQHLARELYADVHGCEPEEVTLEHAWAWYGLEGVSVSWLS
jgi:hypothetical protein